MGEHRPDIEAVLHGNPRSEKWRGFNAGVRAAWRAWEEAEPADLRGAVRALRYVAGEDVPELDGPYTEVAREALRALGITVTGGGG